MKGKVPVDRWLEHSAHIFVHKTAGWIDYRVGGKLVPGSSTFNTLRYIRERIGPPFRTKQGDHVLVVCKARYRKAARCREFYYTLQGVINLLFLKDTAVTWRLGSVNGPVTVDVKDIVRFCSSRAL